MKTMKASGPYRTYNVMSKESALIVEEYFTVESDTDEDEY